MSGAGVVLSITTLHHSLEEVFQERVPMSVGSIQLDCGPVVIAHLAANVDRSQQEVVVAIVNDSAGNRVLVACDKETNLKNGDEINLIKSQMGLTGE